MADKTDKDTCIADSSSTHESICIESTHAVLPNLRQNAIHKKQPIQLRDNQRNLPISNKPYHKAQSGKVKTQIKNKPKHTNPYNNPQTYPNMCTEQWTI